MGFHAMSTKLFNKRRQVLRHSRWIHVARIGTHREIDAFKTHFVHSIGNFVGGAQPLQMARVSIDF